MAFKGLEIDTEIPENRRPQGSINAELHELPVRQKWLDKGSLVYLPRTSLIVLLDRHHTGGMRGIIVVGNKTYPRGGYDIDVSDWEVQRAVVIPDNMLSDAAIAAYQGRSTQDRPPCLSLLLMSDSFGSNQIIRCSKLSDHGVHGEGTEHENIQLRIHWDDVGAIPVPWPKSDEPPAGIDTLVTRRDDGRQVYICRIGDNWMISGSPDRARGWGVPLTWIERMRQIPHDDVMVYPPDAT